MNKNRVLLTSYDENTESVVVSEIAVPTEYEDLVRLLETKLENEILYVDFIREFNKPIYKPLHEITRNYDYCASLAGAFQSFGIHRIHYSIELQEAKDSNKKPEEVKKLEIFYKMQYGKCKKLITHLEHTVAAYNLEKIYKEAEEDEKIIAYSHRKRGWSFPMRIIQPNFKFRFKTNFGFGRKAHFYLQVIFNDFKVVKYSDIIRYKAKPIFEISEYSATYNVHEDSWNEINETLSEMYSNSKNTELFVEKYIVDECNQIEVMVIKIADSRVRDL